MTTSWGDQIDAAVAQAGRARADAAARAAAGRGGPRATAELTWDERQDAARKALVDRDNAFTRARRQRGEGIVREGQVVRVGPVLFDFGARGDEDAERLVGLLWHDGLTIRVGDEVALSAVGQPA